MVLIDPELGQLKFSFFVLSQKRQFLLLSLEFCLILLDQHILVLLELELSFLVKSVLLFSEQFLLLFLVITKEALSLRF